MLLRLSALIEAPRLRRTGRKGYGFGDVGLLIRGFTYKSISGATSDNRGLRIESEDYAKLEGHGRSASVTHVPLKAFVRF